jgi:hypothetical protein
MFKQLVSEDYFSCITEDTLTFTSWAWQFVEALKEGIMYPRWMPLNSWGYGSPIFILYAPLAYYLTALFTLFTGSVITAMNITKFLALFFCGVGMFFLVREFYSEKIAIITAFFYIVFPYNIFQFYYVGTFASTVSFMWFSPILLFTYRHMRDKRYKDVLYAGLCYGGLILTHIINAYMFTFVLVAFIFYMSIAKKEYKNIVIIFFIMIIGFLLSAAYIVPVLFEKQFFTLSAYISYGYNFSDFFILPDMTHKLPHGSFWPVYYDTIIFFIFFFAILIFISLSRVIKIRHMKIIEGSLIMNKFILCIALWSLFLMLGISTFIWENVPYFRFIQFPYRWLNVTTFAVVFLSAVIFFNQDSHYKMKTKRNLFIVLLFLTCLILDYRYINTAHIFTKEFLMPVKPVNWTNELPIWVDIEKIDKNEDIKQLVAIQEGRGRVEVLAWQSAERVIAITAEEPLTVRIRAFNFPGWKAFVDSKQTGIQTEDGTGAIILDIPKGTHTLVLKFEDTPVRFYAKLVSLVMLVLVSFFLIVDRLKSKRHSANENIRE